VPVPDLAGDCDPLLVVVNRPAVISKSVVGEAQVSERLPFAVPVSDLAGDCDALLVVVDRPPVLPKRVSFSSSNEGLGRAVCGKLGQIRTNV
jgi:hypothetical protein